MRERNYRRGGDEMGEMMEVIKCFVHICFFWFLFLAFFGGE